LVVAASHNTTTRRLLGADQFARMKSGAFLVNVARGELIDQDALLESLRTGQIGGAVLDVTTPEPLPADNPLWSAPNLWITPHMSGGTQDGWRAGIELFCANLRAYLAGRRELMGNRVDIRTHL
jgi:phosphoglycerate dehydrogenase-like enzyme